MKATNVKSEKIQHLQFRNRSWWLFRISLMKFRSGMAGSACSDNRDSC